MSTAAINRELGRTFFMEQDRLRGGPNPELCAPTYRATIGTFPAMDLAAHQGFAKAFYEGMPDMKHVIEDIVADDERVVVRFLASGNHTANFMGIPPSGKTVSAPAHVILRVVDGKVVELKAVFDQLALMQQIGAIPVQA